MFYTLQETYEIPGGPLKIEKGDVLVSRFILDVTLLNPSSHFGNLDRIYNIEEINVLKKNGIIHKFDNFRGFHYLLSYKNILKICLYILALLKSL